MQQLSLCVLEDPISDSTVWQQLNEEQQEAAIAVLTRLIIQAATAQPSEEQSHD